MGIMMTLEETYDWVAKESGYLDKYAMFNEISGDKDLVEFYMRLVARKYAEEAINSCIENTIIFSPHGDSNVRMSDKCNPNFKIQDLLK